MDSDRLSHNSEKKHRGLFIILENIIPKNYSLVDIQKLEKELKIKSGKETIKVMKVPEPNSQLLSKISEINSKSEKMGKRASHMANAMERWKIREEILSTLDSGITVILLNFCFKDICDMIDEATNLAWAKTQYIGFIRPDLVLYLDNENENIKKYFGNLKYMENLKSKVEEKVNLANGVKIIRLLPVVQGDNFQINNIINHITKKLFLYQNANGTEFENNFFPKSIGEDLFMYRDY